MDRETFIRTEMLLGSAAMEKLSRSRVAVFGVGGVGGYVVEALARSGVGAIDIVDNDEICLSNVNRQIIATSKNVGEYKVDALKKRVGEINPDCVVTAYKTFVLPENIDEFDFSSFDYVVDAVDTVSAKIALAVKADELSLPIISSMGAGNKLDPLAFKVADVYATKVCPLAKVMRRELKKRGVKALKVVYSEEEPRTPIAVEGYVQAASTRRQTPASIAFVPSVVGLVAAAEVIKDLIKTDN